MHRSPLLAVALAAAVLAAGCDDKAAAPSASAAAPATAPIDYAAWEKGRSTPVADPVYPRHGNPGLDVLHYGLDLNWAPPTKTLTGLATLRIRPAADAASIELDFKPYTLDKVTVDGEPVNGAAVTAERLTVPVAVTEDKPVTLAVAFHGTPSTTPMPSHRGDAEPLGLTVTK
jgi:aminopeptidase N